MDLLEACKLAYRKHHLDDDSIGWDELDNCLLNALCNAMGDNEFNKWIKNRKEMEMTNTERLKCIAEIIEAVDNRCMAVDGPVTPTLKEMTQDEISEIYALAKSRNRA